MNKLELLHRYCCKDSSVTYEISQKLERYLKPESRKHYNFNITLLNALLYIELRGILYDNVNAQRRLKECQEELFKTQYDLDQITGFGVKTQDKIVLRSLIRDTMCYKNDPSRVKKGYESDYEINMRTLLGEGKLTPSELGRLSIALNLHMNVGSPKLKTYLYETLKLPPQRNRQTKELTTDYESILKLKKKSTHGALDKILRMGELRTRVSQLGIGIDPDGRVRSSYNEVGSETGRVTCKKSPTGSGRNAQATADEDTLKDEDDILREGLRDLLVADPGCYMAKCDLKGADGWTIGANLASLGDRTMLDDLLFGIKPAQVVALGLKYLMAGDVALARQVVSMRDRPRLLELCKTIKKDDWIYFACKTVIWGFCYLMGAEKAASQVFKLSQGQVDLSEDVMSQLRGLVFLRYNVRLWHQKMEATLKQPYPPALTSPSGHTRKFFGRKQEILGEALAHEPQSVTTYATNLAMFRLWTDPENRISTSSTGALSSCEVVSTMSEPKRLCKLRIEPLHQVHDEMLVQFRQSDLTWATQKLRQWFNNPIRIAGIEVTIPFDGQVGTNWSMDSEAKVGTI